MTESSRRFQLFDTYWRDLISRVYGARDLTPVEEALYSLSMVGGSIPRSGLAGYFEREWEHLDEQNAALEAHGFGDVAAALRRARELLFGGEPLTQDRVDEGLERYLAESDSAEAMAVDGITESLYDRCEEIMAYRDRLGMDAGLYERMD